MAMERKEKKSQLRTKSDMHGAKVAVGELENSEDQFDVDHVASRQLKNQTTINSNQQQQQMSISISINNSQMDGGLQNSMRRVLPERSTQECAQQSQDGPAGNSINYNMSSKMNLEGGHSQIERGNASISPTDQALSASQKGSRRHFASRELESSDPLRVNEHIKRSNRTLKPATAHPVMDSRKSKSIMVKKKRARTTRGCGIRGAVLISQKYGGGHKECEEREHSNSAERHRNCSLNKAPAQSKLASMRQNLSPNMKSTEAGKSTAAASSLLYKSYAPTGLIKVGNRSVQRLRPSVNEVNMLPNLSRPTTAIRPVVPGGVMAWNYSNYSHLDFLKNTTSRPSSNILPFEIHRGVDSGGLKPLKPIMNVASNPQPTETEQPSELVSEAAKSATPANVEQANFEKLMQAVDGIRLITEFESEQAAIAYATKLQQLYSDKNMDVKVKVEANLQDMEEQGPQDERQGLDLDQDDYYTLSSDKEAQEAMRQRQAIMNKKMGSSFVKINPIQKRPLTSVLHRDDDLTEPRFQRKVNKALKAQKQTSIEREGLSKAQLNEVYQVQQQVYGVLKTRPSLPSLGAPSSLNQLSTALSPNQKFVSQVHQTKLKSFAREQAMILKKLGIEACELEGEVQHASQIISNDNKIPKSRAKFYQREQRFKKIFEAQIEQWRKESSQLQEHSITPQAPEKPSTFNMDVQLYKEREDDYRIIANKVFLRACEDHPQGRNYINKNAYLINKNFDPLRIRLRIMPISRAPLAQGKTPDYYFREAAKDSLSGDLTKAIERLKRGLLINPDHFLCRFNHGVLMFKQGLILEACEDFDMLTRNAHGRKDAWVFYNLATCLIQTGTPCELNTCQERERVKNQRDLQRRLSAVYGHIITDVSYLKEKALTDTGTRNYAKAIDMCDKTVELSGQDKQVKHDALCLKGVCLFRMGQLIQAVAALFKARRIKQMIQEDIEEQRRLRLLRNLVEDPADKFFTRNDLAPLRKKRSNSFFFTRHKMVRKINRKKRERRHSWSGYDFDWERTRHEKSVIDGNSNNGGYMGENNTPSAVSIASDNESSSTPKSESKADDSQVQSTLQPSGVPSPYERSSTKRKRPPSSQAAKKLRYSLFNIEGTGLNQQQMRRALVQRLLNAVQKHQNMQKAAKKNELVMNAGKMDELFEKLQQQKKELEEDRISLNMSKNEYAMFRKAYIELKKESDQIKDQHNPLFRLKNMYLREYDVKDPHAFDDISDLEKNEILKRKAILKWIDDDLVTLLLLQAADAKKAKVRKSSIKQSRTHARAQSLSGDNFNLKFVQKLLEVAEVKDEERAGSHVDNILDIISEQAQMDYIMEDLSEKVVEMQRAFEKELNRGHAELNAPVPRPDEMRVLRGEQHLDVEDTQMDQEDKIITRLRDALKSESQTPDEVINILHTSIYEKAKLKLQMNYIKGGVDSDDEGEHRSKPFVKRSAITKRSAHNFGNGGEMRFTERHIQMIANQFKAPMYCRNHKVLDLLLRHLRYLKRHDLDVRQQFYNKAEFVEFGPQTVIFRKGDNSDYMYIILKGRISVESNPAHYTDIQVIINTLKDGEQFGELSFVDQAKFNEVKGSAALEQLIEESSRRPRAATCKTVEQSRLLRINLLEFIRIIQPSLTKQTEITKISDYNRTIDDQTSLNASIQPVMQDETQQSIPTEPREQITDDVNKRLAFLQGFDFFRDLKKKVIFPVAVNMHLVKFKYGQFLTREGQIPPGMFLIKSGQCIVGLARTSTRVKDYNDIPGQRKPVQDRHLLFNEFDPENSLLNNVEMTERVFQNGRIYVGTDGKQIRNNICYHDIMEFSKLLPFQQFGGRSLPPFELYLQLRRIYFGDDYVARPTSKDQPNAKGEKKSLMKEEERYQMKSFLDVIADSGIVETYLITKQEIQYLSDQHLKTIFDMIVQQKEPDRPCKEAQIITKREQILKDERDNRDRVKKIRYANKIEKYGVMAVKDLK